MKHLKTVLAIFAVLVLALAATSCSRSSMRKGTSMRNDAKRGIDNAIRQGENVVDYGLGALDGNGDAVGDRYYRGGKGMNDGFGTYGANSGYDAYTGNGSTSVGTRTRNDGMDLFPTLRDTSNDNFGQINTTNGKADGGMGDMYDDTDLKRNSLRTDKYSKKYVKQ